MTYINVDERQEHCRVLSCQNNQLCAQHGLKDFPVSSMHPLKNLDTRIWSGDFHTLDSCRTGKAALGSPVENRLYRSVENLHWAAVADSGLLSHCRSLDNEIGFGCRGSGQWAEGCVDVAPLRSASDSVRNLSLRPKQTSRAAQNVLPFAKVPQWLFPSAEERALRGDAKKELKEKLRLHSSKVAEPSKPLRPQAALSELVAQELSECQLCRQHRNGCAGSCCTVLGEHTALRHGLAGRQSCCAAHRPVSPEDIKQEAQRRLQLRRQNSSPSLPLQRAGESPEMAKSRTAEFLERRSGEITLGQGKKGRCRGRLYIPTFEEFKQMRSKEAKPPAGSSEPTKCLKKGLMANQTLDKESNNVCPVAQGTKAVNEAATTEDDDDVFHENNTTTGFAQYPAAWDGFRTRSPEVKERTFQISSPERSPIPICSSPIPRSPLQAVATHKAGQEIFSDEQQKGETSQLNDVLHLAGQSLASEAQSSCCSSLLLEATDLSSYGAKLQKMKDEFIGSALELIKKSCNAETAAKSPSKGQCDLKKADLPPPEDSQQPAAMSMATETWEEKASSETSSEAQPAGNTSSPGCRRSSSDIVHESGAKAQRECRLRPHFSDPMPTDSVKRKQLELKIAAAARQHAQKRRQERDYGPVVAKANLGHGGSFDETRRAPRGALRSRHHWSNVSSLSTDSGIVGLNDAREELDASGEAARTKPAEVERADSGIGQTSARKWRSRAAETLSSLQAWEAHRPCTDCGERDLPAETDVQNCNQRRADLCEKCRKRRTERKESVLEFVNTEASYGEDLRIIKEEFYLPMQAAGLLSQEQLLGIFSNIQELIDLNENFLEILQEEIDQAFDQGDDDLMTVCIGEIFLEFVNMLPAFQTYCLQQSSSVNMLNALEKEKELLRIFLDVSQNDNTALRRMNLRSFLMAPLQRVTKYPLLLSRIIKATTEYHPDHGSLREAKSRIESHLEHINMKTKQEGNTWTLRSFRQDSKKKREVINIEMRETALKTVGWLREETRFVMEGALQLAQPPDGQWVKKGSKTLKFQNMQVLLLVNMKRVSESSLELAEPGPVKDAVLVLIRDKNNGKFHLLREPLRLSNCIVSTDPDCDDTFELIEIRREAFVFRDSDRARTHHWFRQIRRYSRELGSWKKRRNALPNIMISTPHTRP
uniref:DH domain-containing protein n=1 Tax=Cairina moschata TaxID=8855 RepID=A0A8C3D189_CAIMO